MADERIRLLHVVGSAGVGSVETFVLNVARHIDRGRFAVSVVVTGHDGPLAGELRRAGAREVFDVRGMRSLESLYMQALAERPVPAGLAKRTFGSTGLRKP